MGDFEKMMRDYRRESERRAESARAAIIKALREAKVDRVEVEFDGGGDSGQIEGISYYPKQSKSFGETEVSGTQRETTSWVSGEPKRVVRNCTIDELVEEACYSILSGQHPGWEINEGSFGNFVIDVGSDKVLLTFNQRIESVESYDEEY